MRVRAIQCCSDRDMEIMTGFKLQFKSIDLDYVNMKNYDPDLKFYAGPPKQFTTDCIGRECDSGNSRCGEFNDIDARIDKIDLMKKSLNINDQIRNVLVDMKITSSTDDENFEVFACGKSNEGIQTTFHLENPLIGFKWEYHTFALYNGAMRYNLRPIQHKCAIHQYAAY